MWSQTTYSWPQATTGRASLDSESTLTNWSSPSWFMPRYAAQEAEAWIPSKFTSRRPWAKCEASLLLHPEMGAVSVLQCDRGLLQR